MNNVIYQIQFSDGTTYFGKLANSDNILWTHMRWLPWMPSFQGADKRQSTWERIWYNQILRTGFKNQTFVQRYGYLSATTVERNLRVSMASISLTIDNKPVNLFDVLCDVWKKDAYEVCEALCILLAAHHNAQLQNTQIDFLSRVTQGGTLSAKDVATLTSNEEFQRRYTVAVGGLADSIYFNFKRRNQSVLEELAQAIGVNLDRHRTKTGALSFRSADMKKLAQELTYHITQKTVNDLMTQVRYNAKKSGGNNAALEPLLQELETALRGKAYTASGKLRKIQYKELFKILYDFLATNTSGQWEIFQQRTNINISDALRRWLDMTSLSTVFPATLHQITKRDEDYYKRHFASWIQTNVFGAFTLNPAYTAAQYQKYLASAAGQRGEAQLPSRAGTEYADNFALITQTKQYLPAGNYFMLTNWFNGIKGASSLYGEQVSIWLGTTDPFNCWHNIPAFSNQPQSVDDTERITIY